MNQGEIEDDSTRKGKFRLSKETTYFEEPLDKFGYVDYPAALNKRLRKGVTPENNASVVFWNAIGPRSGGLNPIPKVFEWLGIPQPPEKGEYFIGLDQFMREQLKLKTREEFDEIDSQHRIAMQSPWTAKKFPHLAAWLKTNERPLAVIVMATKRTHYFSPIVFHESVRRPDLVSQLLPGVQKCREVSKALAARAMLRACDQPDDAWQDLLTCHKLGRLIGAGSTLIESLVGKAIDETAARADVAFLEHAKPNAKRLEKCLDDLQRLKPFDIAAQIELTERCVVLEAASNIDREGVAALDKAKSPEGAYRVFEEMDWDPVLQSANKWFDRLAVAVRISDRSQREKELDAIESELVDLAKKFLLAKRPDEPHDGQSLARSREHAIVGNLIATVFSSYRGVLRSFEKSGQQHNLLIVAVALNWYQFDHGRYPKELSTLAPKYLKQVPIDVFSGKDLIYRPTDNEFLLYSVGLNGKDDEGRDAEGSPDGDDLCIRFPKPSQP